MKKLFILLSLFILTGISSFAQIDTARIVKKTKIDSVPRPLGWVSDFENIYSKSEIKTLDSLITSFEKKSGIEIAIVTLDGAQTNDSAFDAYVLTLANAWGVGKKGKDNGITIGISSEFGRIRIVNGAGVTNKLDDDETKLIIDSIFIANFKEGNYFKGTKEGVLEIMKKLK
jgi:uncharacterized protein